MEIGDSLSVWPLNVGLKLPTPNLEYVKMWNDTYTQKYKNINKRHTRPGQNYLTPNCLCLLIISRGSWLTPGDRECAYEGMVTTCKKGKKKKKDEASLIFSRVLYCQTESLPIYVFKILTHKEDVSSKYIFFKNAKSEIRVS